MLLSKAQHGRAAQRILVSLAQHHFFLFWQVLEEASDSTVEFIHLLWDTGSWYGAATWQPPWIFHEFPLTWTLPVCW